MPIPLYCLNTPLLGFPDRSRIKALKHTLPQPGWPQSNASRHNKRERSTNLDAPFAKDSCALPGLVRHSQDLLGSLTNSYKEFYSRLWDLLTMELGHFRSHWALRFQTIKGKSIQIHMVRVGVSQRWRMPSTTFAVSEENPSEAKGTEGYMETFHLLVSCFKNNNPSFARSQFGPQSMGLRAWSSSPGGPAGRGSPAPGGCPGTSPSASPPATASHPALQPKRRKSNFALRHMEAISAERFSEIRPNCINMRVSSIPTAAFCVDFVNCTQGLRELNRKA